MKLGECCAVAMLTIHWMDSSSWFRGETDDPGAESNKSLSSTRVCQFQHERNESQPGASVIAPTDDTRLLTKAALQGVERIYREDFRYSKAEVLLLDLSQRGETTGDLFAESQPVSSERLMGVLDSVNARWGRGTLRLASVPDNPSWGMRRETMSQSFTTKMNELWTVFCK